MQRILVNTPHIEIWPAGLLRARSNRDARILARARHVLRRKRDGRFLAAELAEGLQALAPLLEREPGIDDATTALRQRMPMPSRLHAADILPLHRLQERLAAIGLDEGYGARSGLELVAEPHWLALAGFDRYRRALWLQADAANAWMRLRQAALRDGVLLEAISGYRSHDYQLGIFERKRARGLDVDAILAVNAAPGYSEHHSGRALDISAPGEPAAEESFEGTAAFGWLAANAGGHGFAMSYPRDNPHGIVYEPWHWCWQPAAAGRAAIIPASA
ncbi:M15 family metallopeptidase [Cognatiluteimonas profundi]|uniref:M15 family metallopeptidase n=1 Tax=Cognatiluteimonas profundi TaxID=2594501 RepID=UPI00131C4BEC|nr:M15 family metallopeptidase [Lysobacter profundi]